MFEQVDREAVLSVWPVCLFRARRLDVIRTDQDLITLSDYFGGLLAARAGWRRCQLFPVSCSSTL